MKKILLIIIVYLSITELTGQNFIDTNKVWNVYSCNGPFFNSCVTFTYKFKSDTVINSITYNKLYSSMDSIPTNWGEVGFFREDTLAKKVFWYLNNQDELLYDFNLNVGDTAKVIASFGNPYPFCPFKMVVDSIKFNTYFGVTRKQWYFNSPYFYGQETWIAGIGNLFGPNENSTLFCTADYGPRLICYKEGLNLKFMDTNFSDCYQTTLGISEVENQTLNLSIYPNPTENEFNLKTNNNRHKKIIVRNELGQNILESQTTDINILINISDAGIYFITVIQENKTWTGKLIKF